MKAYGIEFTHRAAYRVDAETSKDFSSFTRFASLLDSSQSADSVVAVNYDTNSQTFHIEMKLDADGLDYQMVHDAARMSLDQYEIDGYIYHAEGMA
jgi:hypothetical protein